MADTKLTPDQSAAEKIGRSIDGQIFRLNEERATLLKAAERLAEIDAELAVLTSEKQKIEPRRPPKPADQRDPKAAPATPRTP